MNSAKVPKPVTDVQGEDRWMSQHNRYIHEAKEREPDLVLIGDSLIRKLALTEIWKKSFEPLHPLNFGISADSTQHVLWRVINGEMDNMQPKVIVLLVGTNNHNNTDVEVVEGILEIAKEINSRQQQAKIIIMGIPPRGQHPNKLREKVSRINQHLAEQAANIPNTSFLATDPALFVNKHDEISHTDMYDYLHFTESGYEKLCQPLLVDIHDKLKASSRKQ